MFWAYDTNIALLEFRRREESRLSTSLNIELSAWWHRVNRVPFVGKGMCPRQHARETKRLPEEGRVSVSKSPEGAGAARMRACRWSCTHAGSGEIATESLADSAMISPRDHCKSFSHFTA